MFAITLKTDNNTYYLGNRFEPSLDAGNAVLYGSKNEAKSEFDNAIDYLKSNGWNSFVLDTEEFENE